MPWPYSWAMTPESMSESRLMERVGSGARVAPNGWLALKRAAVQSLTITDGIVIVGSAPPRVTAGPGTLLTTMRATAPAAWAVAALTVKLQLPRSSDGDVAGREGDQGLAAVGVGRPGAVVRQGDAWP